MTVGLTSPGGRLHGVAGHIGGTTSSPLTIVEQLAARRAAYGDVTAVATRSTMGATFTETDQYNGGVLGPDGTVFGVPDESDTILVVDPEEDTAFRSNLGATLDNTTKKYVGGVYHPDTGLIYTIPSRAKKIMVLDPDTPTVLAQTMDFGQAGRWRGGVVAPNGLIYCCPSSASWIIVIDPYDTTESPYGTMHLTKMGAELAAGAKWASFALAENGVIYASPDSAPDVLRIDVTDLTAGPFGTATRVDYGLDLAQDNKWQGLVLGADGCLYGVPFYAPDILRIDPSDETATRSNMGADIPSGDTKWQNACNGPDGRIYCFPRNRTEILRIDPIGGTAMASNFGATLPAGGSKFQSGVQTMMGDIIGIPQDADDILRISFPGVPPMPPEVVLDPLLNHL